MLELKDKLKGHSFADADAEESISAFEDVSTSDKRADALSALTVLGYTRGEADAVLKKIDTSSLEVDDIIREALKKLMR